MANARLYFNGDNTYTEKQKRVHKLTEEVESKIDAIPQVVDNLTSTSTTAALSANMGKELQDQITELKSMGRFLSTWDCTTGTPTTDPIDDPYVYKTGDYYIISKISSDVNYRPHGSVYVAGSASTSIESEEIAVNDWYIYDGAAWVLQSQNQIVLAIDAQLSSSSRNAVENRVITNTLNEKQDTIGDIESIRSGASKGATSIQPGDSLSLLDNSASGFQTAGDVATAISTKADTSVLTELSNTVSTLQATVEEQATTIENIEIATGGDTQAIANINTNITNIQGDITNIQNELGNKVDTSDLATVATTGSYNDLLDKPTTVSANNGMLTVYQNGTVKGSFTANASEASNIYLTDTTYSSLAAADGGSDVSLVTTGEKYLWNSKQDQLDTLSSSDIQTGTSTTAGAVTSDALASSLVRIASNTSGTKTQIWTGTQAEYEALETKEGDTLYFTVN